MSLRRLVAAGGAIVAGALIVDLGVAVLLPQTGWLGHPVATLDPRQSITVVNASPRAVMVFVGPRTTAARPCGGDVTVAVEPSDFTEDGRLIAALAIDPTGNFDLELEGYQGDPLEMPGKFSASPIWSDGTMADRMPATLVVGSDLNVTGRPEDPPAASLAACTPKWSTQ